MPKELRITITVKLPDEMFAEADMLVAAKKPVKELAEHLIAACGEKAVTVDYGTVAPKPRGKAKDVAAPAPRLGARHETTREAA